MSERSSKPSWAQIRDLLDQVLDLPAAERTAAIRGTEAAPQLQEAVLSMLGAYEEETEPFAKAVVDVSGLLPEPFQAGDGIGAYKLIERVGEGGMGTVFIAQRADDAYSKNVAIKLIRRGWASEEEIRRFRSERQILADLEHPSIARLLDGGETSKGQPFLVMEFVDGQPLDTYCRRHELALEGVLSLFLEVCRAVQFAHQSLIVHRDLKPSNILVTLGDSESSGDGGRVKLLDFGIAKILEPSEFAGPVEQTRTGSTPMTPAYASPEQVSGGSITTATDVYALGLLLYQLLTGDLPYRFDGRDMPAIVDAVVHREVTAPSSRLRALAQKREEGTEDQDSTRPLNLSSRTLSGDLDAIILKALAKDPSHRYATAEQLADDLQRYLDHRPVRARRDTLIYRGSKFLHRYRYGLAAAMAVFAILIFSIFVLLGQQERLVDERNHAVEQTRRAETVTGYLVDLFEVSDPGHSFGEQVTARELLDKSVHSIDQELADQPQLLPEMLGVLAQTYSGLGQLDEAEDLVTRAIRRARSQEGGQRGSRSGRSPEDAEGLQADSRLPILLFHLSEVLAQQGRFAASRSVISEAMTRLDFADSGIERGLLFARCLAQRGWLDSRLGNLEWAAEQLEEARSLASLTHDPETMADVQERVGEVHLLRGEPEAAKTALNHALELRRGLHDERHPRVTLLRSTLATLEKPENPESGERVLRQAIEDQRRLFHGAHPILAISTNNLARLLGDRGEYEEAEELYNASLDMKYQIFTPTHPSIATTLTNLAGLKNELGDLDGAEVLYAKALGIFEKELGREHPDYALCLANLGTLMMQRRETESARHLLEKALNLVLERLGGGHERALVIRTSLSHIENMEGRPEKARDLLRQAIDEARANENGSATFSKTLYVLSDLESALGQSDAAKELHEEVVDRDGTHTLIGRFATTQLAHRAWAREDWRQAEIYGRQAVEAWRSRGVEGPWMHSARGSLGLALVELGRPEEGVEILEIRWEKARAARGEGTLTEEAVEGARRDLDRARAEANKM